MTTRADLPRLDDLPIPPDTRTGPGWTTQMLDLAAQIGAYPTLLIVAAFGGQRVSVSRDPDRSPFLDLIGRDAAAKVAWLYGGTRFQVPVARAAVARARRGAVLARVRERTLTVGDAAAILGTSRSYVAHLVNVAEEGRGTAPMSDADLADHRPRQLDMFAEEDCG